MSGTRRRTAALVLAPALAVAVLATLTSAPAASAGQRHDPPRPGRHAGPVTASWQPVTTGAPATTRFRGLDAVSRKVAWVAGWNTTGTGDAAVDTGVVQRTGDGGRTWQVVSPPDVTGLQFRDIEVLDRRHAVVMAAGVGDASRIYRTADGGRTWSLSFTGSPDTFLDCIAFFDQRRGLAMGDPINGKFLTLATLDGGRTWTETPRTGMPDAVPAPGPGTAGEAGFAASGTCLTTVGHRDAWFASGGAAARVFHSRDAGRTWTVASTPIGFDATSGAAGIFSLAFRDREHGLAVGGDFLQPTQAVDAAALTDDGGSTWSLVPAAAAPRGYRSGSAWVSTRAHTSRHHVGRAARHGLGGRRGATAVVVGPTGSELSTDGGRTWTPIPAPAGQAGTAGYDSVECARDGACWASGPQGQAARLALR